MSFYQSLREGPVRNSLKKYGFPVVLTRSESEGYTPGQTEVVDLIDIEGLGLLDMYRGSEVDGEVILRGDARLWYEGQEPKIGDSFELDDSLWRVVNVNPIKPGGFTVIWELQVRK